MNKIFAQGMSLVHFSNFKEMTKIITEEDIGKTFEASELGITFHSSKHKTLKVADVWVRDHIKYIQLICNENASICRLLKIPVERIKKRILPPSFP